MLVKRIDATSEDLLDPGGSPWQRVRSSKTVLSPTPLEMQPSEYIRVSWKGRPYGKAPSMQVTGLHNGREIFFKLVWSDDTADGKIADIDQFIDSAAVLFPIAGDAPLFGMGAKDKPVNAWFWRADWEQPKNIAAEGMGTTQRRDDPALSSSARHRRGRWEVVLSHSMNGRRSPKGTAALKAGTVSKVAFAVWQGGNQERAGVKAFSPDWQELEIEA